MEKELAKKNIGRRVPIIQALSFLNPVFLEMISSTCCFDDPRFLWEKLHGLM